MPDRTPPDADLTTNRVLLDAYRRGEPWALKTVYRAYVERVTAMIAAGFQVRDGARRFRCSGVQRRFDLEVIVQDTFTRAFAESTRGRYDGLRPFAAFLRGIARHACLDWVRAQSAQRATPTASPEPAPALGPEPHAAIEGHELEGLLLEFVGGLDDERRSLFELRFRDQEPQAQTARTLGITRIRLRRMEAKLKRDLFSFLRGHGYFTHFRPPPSSLLAEPAIDAGGADDEA